MKSKNSEFQDKLIRLQGLAGFSQEEAAVYLGVHINTYKNWFLGKMTPRKRESIVTMEDVLEKMEKAANKAFINAGIKNFSKQEEKD